MQIHTTCFYGYIAEKIIIDDELLDFLMFVEQQDPLSLPVEISTTSKMLPTEWLWFGTTNYTERVIDGSFFYI